MMRLPKEYKGFISKRKWYATQLKKVAKAYMKFVRGEVTDCLYGQCMASSKVSKWWKVKCAVRMIPYYLFKF